MEEIYISLEERLENIKHLLIKIENYENSLLTNSSQTNFERKIELNEIYTLFNQMKKHEKVRIIKENDFIEVVFGLRNFDLQQRMRFQIKSMELMQKINTDFVYEKAKKTGETKDIAKQFLKFFVSLNLTAKVDDLKRYPIISILMKWLVEISRNHYQVILKDKIAEIEALTLKTNSSNSSSNTASRPKSNYHRSAFLFEEGKGQFLRVEKVSPRKNRKIVSNPPTSRKKEKTEASEEDHSTTNFNPNNNSNIYYGMYNPKSIKPRFEEKPDPLNYSREPTVTISTSASTVSSAALPLNINKFDNTLNNFNSSNSQKIINTDPFRYRLRNQQLQIKSQTNVIQVFIPNYLSGYNHLDILEDLDTMHITTVYQFFISYRQIKKNQSGAFITIDLEKRKEMMLSVYKNLWQRNLDIEKTVNDYRMDYNDKKKYEEYMKTNYKRQEFYIDGYQIDFPKKFPHIMIVTDAIMNENDYRAEGYQEYNNRSPIKRQTPLKSVLSNSINILKSNEKDKHISLNLSFERQNNVNSKPNQFKILNKKASPYRANASDKIIGKRLIITKSCDKQENYHQHKAQIMNDQEVMLKKDDAFEKILDKINLREPTEVTTAIIGKRSMLPAKYENFRQNSQGENHRCASMDNKKFLNITVSNVMNANRLDNVMKAIMENEKAFMKSNCSCNPEAIHDLNFCEQRLVLNKNNGLNNEGIIFKDLKIEIPHDSQSSLEQQQKNENKQIELQQAHFAKELHGNTPINQNLPFFGNELKTPLKPISKSNSHAIIKPILVDIESNNFVERNKIKSLNDKLKVA